MDLNTLWFLLIGVIFCAFFFLEGFDYGVGVLSPFLARKDVEKRILINTIGPVWDGNEVWMILAAGAIFATFPAWYATLFSSFYLFMFVILISLIVRNVSFEFRGKGEGEAWKKLWDGAFFIGSLIPALIWGILFTDLLLGIPINEAGDFTGSFGDLIRPLSLAGGLMGLLLFTFHGSVFLLLRTEGAMWEKVKKLSGKLGLAAAVGGLLFFIGLLLQGQIFSKPLAAAAAMLALLAVIGVNVLLHFKKFKLSMFVSGLSVALSVFAVFAGLFPNVLISSLNPANTLDIYNAASSPYTLKVITICGLTLLPVVIAYQIWTYRVFRTRVTAKELEY